MTRLSVAEARLAEGRSRHQLLDVRYLRILFVILSFFFRRYRRFEAANAFAQAFTQFGEFLGPKYQEGYASYHE
jgi:hypothetical protein